MSFSTHRIDSINYLKFSFIYNLFRVTEKYD